MAQTAVGLIELLRQEQQEKKLSNVALGKLLGRSDVTITDVYWCQGVAIWNNDGDTVYLYGAGWNLIDSYQY